MNEEKDTKYSWFIVVISFYAQISSVGILFSFGLIYVEILHEYKVAESTAAWVGSTAFSICFLFGFLSSSLCVKLGYGKCMSIGGVLTSVGLLISSFAPNIFVLFISYGVLTGLGMSMLFFSSLLVIPLYFHKYLSTVNGIVSTGCNVSSLWLSPFLTFINKNYGIRVTFQVLSAFTALLFIMGFFVKRQSRNKEMFSAYTLVDKSLLKNKPYLLLVAAMCVMMTFYYAPFIHLFKFAEIKNVSPMQSTFLLTVLLGCGTIGKIISGFIGQNKHINILYVFQVSILSMSVATTLLPLSNTYFHLVIFAVVFGSCDGIFYSYIFLMTKDLVKLDQVSFAFGTLHTVSSLFSMIGSPVLALIYETTQSYGMAFLTCGGVYIISAFLLFGIDFLKSTDKPDDTVKNNSSSYIDTDKLSDSGVECSTEDLGLLSKTLEADRNSRLKGTHSLPKTLWSMTSNLFDRENNIKKDFLEFV